METSIKENNNPPLYNSKLVNNYIKYIKRHYPLINVNSLLQYAGMESYQVDDPSHWFTQEQVNLFHDKLKKMTGNIEVAREVGKYTASPEAVGLLKRYILGLVSLPRIYELAGRAASKVTRSSTYSSSKLGPNMVELKVALNKGVQEEPFQCENRLGWIEALAKIFNYKLRKIEHPECLFKGGNACRYIVSWKKSPVAFWEKVRNYSALSFAVILPGTALIAPVFAFTTLTPLFLGLLILLNWQVMQKEINVLNTAVINLSDSAEEYHQQSNLYKNNALMINEIGEALSKPIEIKDIYNQVAQILENRLDYDRGMILLAQNYSTRLAFKAGYGYTDEQLSLLHNTVFSLNNPKSKGVFVASFIHKKPFLVSDIDEISDSLSIHSLNFARKMGAKSFICCPIIYAKESLGILTVDNKKTKRPLVQSDINMLMGIAAQIGISMHNAILRDAEARQYKANAQVLEANIDAKNLCNILPKNSSYLEKGIDSQGRPLF